MAGPQGSTPTLVSMPIGIKKMIVEELMPMEIDNNQDEGSADLCSITTLFSLLRIKSFEHIVPTYLRKASRIIGLKAVQRFSRWTDRCRRGSVTPHSGPCWLRNDPRPTPSAWDWIATFTVDERGNALERQKIIDSVFEKVGQYCGMRHLHAALGCKNLDVAERMLSLPLVKRELDITNGTILNCEHFDEGTFVTTPSHPIFAALKAHKKFPHTPGATDALIRLLPDLLPRSTVYFGECNYPWITIAHLAIDTFDLDIVKLVFDHQERYSTSRATHSRTMAGLLWGSTRFLAMDRADEAYPVRDEISRRCHGTAWLVPAILLDRNDEHWPRLAELAWRDIFNVPAENWEGPETWRSVPGNGALEESMSDILLMKVLTLWEVPRIARVLQRLADPSFIPFTMAPQKLGEFLVEAANIDDKAQALALVKLLWDYSKKHQTAYFEDNILDIAVNIAEEQGNPDLAKFLEGHGAMNPFSTQR